ncbi:ferredoxin [Streptomyces sp. NPDC053560]|uniref:ferredoxin n=1 Tax=Streptomyces sp. NPDC053560 TaxID=3365711 RepID=UPI0037D07CFF
MRVAVDEDRCIGAGQCELAAPEVFEQDDEGLSRASDPEPAQALWQQVRQAADLCPVQAVLLTGTTGTAPSEQQREAG